MLIEAIGLQAVVDPWTDDDPGNLAATVRVIRLGLVKHQNQHAILLEDRAGDQRIDVVLKPRIGGRERTVMGIVT